MSINKNVKKMQKFVFERKSMSVVISYSIIFCDCGRQMYFEYDPDKEKFPDLFCDLCGGYKEGFDPGKYTADSSPVGFGNLNTDECLF